MEQRYAVLVLFVLLLMNVRVSKAIRHRVNEFKKIELTKHVVIIRSAACDGILKSRQEFCASILVIVEQRDGEA